MKTTSFLFYLFALSFIFFQAPVHAQQEMKDFRRTALSFDLSQATKLLDARPFITTSAHFENPEGYEVDFGKSVSGIRWGNYSVSVSSGTSLFVLKNISSDHTRRAGDTFISVAGLRWNEEKGKYEGYGEYYGRGPRNCPLNSFPARIEIDIWKTHPFQGAFHSLTAYYTTNHVTNDTCRVIRREEARAQATRTFTTAETLRAIEQANDIFDRHSVDLRAWLSSKLAEVQAISPATDEVKSRVEQVVKGAHGLRDRLDKIESLIDETDWALKFGGRVRDIHSGEWHDFERPNSLDRAPSFLFQATGLALEEALAIEKHVNEIKE